LMVLSDRGRPGPGKPGAGAPRRVPAASRPRGGGSGDR
jgi:hypothetical protein